MKKIIFFLCVSLFSTSCFCQSEATSDDLEKSLSALVSYNFLGGNKANIANLTPEVFYGWNKQTFSYKKISMRLKVGPYVSSQIKVADSASYLPALMLQGNGGIIANSYFLFTNGQNTFMISPLSLGLKILGGFNDTSKSILQHNLRFAAGYKYSDLIAVTVQYTVGWHDLTSQSVEGFKTIFKDDPKRATYLNVTLQSKISNDDGGKNPWYLFAVWRTFLNNQDYNDLPNKRFITFGVRKSLDLEAGMPAKVKMF